MTIGTGTFFPAGKFTQPRSYIVDFVFFRQGGTITHLAGRFTLHAPPPNPTFAVIQLRNNFYLWNSNRWQLPYIVSESWYKLNGVGPEIAMPFSLSWQMDPVTLRSTIYYAYFGTSTDPETFTLPTQPLNYWLPPPL